MEQIYKDKLIELGFTADPESVKTVFATRAYHNTFNGITDCSYGVLTVPACLSAKRERLITEVLFDILSTAYYNTERITHYSPANLPRIRIENNRIQFEFSDALTEKQMVDKLLTFLRSADEQLNRIHIELSLEEPRDPNYEKTELVINTIINRIEAIRVFIEAGSTSYEYNLEAYHPLD